jgi:hypothetical protein
VPDNVVDKLQPPIPNLVLQYNCTACLALYQQNVRNDFGAVVVVAAMMDGDYPSKVAETTLCKEPSEL